MSTGGKEELDETRIHPDKYRLAGEIASCSLKLSDGLSSKYQKEVDPIHYYREHSEATTFVTVERFPFDDISLLCFIQRELRRPFEDYREPYIEPSAEEEFFLLTGETKETLGDGKVVRATVRRVSESKILCALESGLPAWINPQDLPEELRYRGRSMQEGDVLSCRVKEIKAQEFAVLSPLLPLSPPPMFFSLTFFSCSFSKNEYRLFSCFLLFSTCFLSIFPLFCLN